MYDAVESMHMSKENKSGSSTETESGSDRRRFFRINDHLVLNVILIEPGNTEQEMQLFQEKRDAFCAMNNADLDHDQNLGALRSIEQLYPDVAKYIAYLERRIDVLEKVVSAQESHENEEHYRVNISAQGMRFYSAQRFAKNDLLEMQIILLPNRKHVLLIATVIWCEDDPQAIDERKYATAVDFTTIHQADREVLAKHIHDKQIKQLHLRQDDS